MTEKHKLNVPETMTEILDVSDEEGKLRLTSPLFRGHLELCIVGSFETVGLKAVCFIVLRLEEEPLSEMPVELEGTAKCLCCSASMVWTILVFA